MEVAGGSVHSCHTALSNYSTIAATQVMEFQLKYDSFRICFYSQESQWGLHFMGWGAMEWTTGRVSYRRHIFQSIFSIYPPPYSPPHPPSKGNDLVETLLFGGTQRLEPGARQKWGVMIKVFVTRSQKLNL